jgi:histidinol-phosphate aminotransferase
MYRFYSQLAGRPRRRSRLPAGKLAFPLEELLDRITPQTKAVLISNPNNPTGTGTTVSGLEKILRKAQHAAVLVDEAYYEFCGVTMLNRLRDHANLFVSRTFSKVYGMAAMRCGCLFSQAVKHGSLTQSPIAIQREFPRRHGRPYCRARHQIH